MEFCRIAVLLGVVGFMRQGVSRVEISCGLLGLRWLAVRQTGHARSGRRGLRVSLGVASAHWHLVLGHANVPLSPLGCSTSPRAETWLTVYRPLQVALMGFLDALA